MDVVLLMIVVIVVIALLFIVWRVTGSGYAAAIDSRYVSMTLDPPKPPVPCLQSMTDQSSGNAEGDP